MNTIEIMVVVVLSLGALVLGVLGIIGFLFLINLLYGIGRFILVVVRDGVMSFMRWIYDRGDLPLKKLLIWFFFD